MWEISPTLLCYDMTEPTSTDVALAGLKAKTFHNFGLQIPMGLQGVPHELLNPRISLTPSCGSHGFSQSLTRLIILQFV